MNSRRLTWRVVLAATGMMAALATSTPAGAGLKVWTVTGTQRVLRDDQPPLKAPKEVELFAARNEWESFQILLRCDKPVASISLEPGTLRGPGNAEIHSRLAALYRMHQMEIRTPSHRNSSFTPGWYPDPLVPLTHSLTGEPLEGGRIKSAPLDLPADQTHGFLVDLYVPADAAPGVYKTVYHVLTLEGQTIEVPVTLTVWNFALPRVPALHTSLGSPSSRLRKYYRDQAKKGKQSEPSRWGLVEAQVDDLLTKHRINATPRSDLLVPTETDGQFTFTPDQVSALKTFIARQPINAICVPHPRSAVKDPLAQKERLGKWLKAFDALSAALGREIVFYTYLKDEPNDAEAYEYVRTWGKAVRQAGSVVKVLVVEQCDTQNADWGDLYGAVDIWCPLFCLFKEEPTRERQKAGETIWTYTALCQGKTPTPWWQIDFPLTNYRAPAWIAWRYRVRGLLYWGGLCYWDQVDDPWNQAWTYGRPKDGKGKGLVYNGEGVLAYPARAVGYDGLAPSLRLKALRDGIEDYDYLALLEGMGLAEQAEKIVLPLAESWTRWSGDAVEYQKARSALAELIVKGNK